ncbi:hypothetical protein GWR21_09635 [Chitinophaga agri]|uniref:Uncharacterized protein n=1 Tax=Chitinophaga agri TaxID=2703787 RepID=A0A6B9ZQN4_9BACT|nr:hypothetical protein GWR21_09635 [Chitinophaga agri]
MAGHFEKIQEAALPADAFKYLNGPAIIYPFLRRHVYSLICKAGLGAMMLPAVSFQPR